MAFWRIDRSHRPSDAGFATPAAAVVSLGLAVVASALTVLAISELKAARSEAAKTRAEYQLEGVQQRAGLAVITEPKATRLEWTIPTSNGSAEVLAESEGYKLGLQQAAGLDGVHLQKLNVIDGADLRRRLQALSADQAVGPALEQADASPLWRACARSLISAYGAAKIAPKLTHAAPGSRNVISRAGEVWRIRAVADGWADDRIVRLTGDPAHLAAVIERQVYRRAEGRERCDALFSS